MLKKLVGFLCIIFILLPAIASSQTGSRPRPPDSPPTGTATPREETPTPPANPPQGSNQAPPPRPYWPGNPYSFMSPYGYWYMPPNYYLPPPDGSIRLKVKPNNAEVYIDGGFCGYVDDYNGAFQKLRLREGFYSLEIKAEGYKPFEIQIRISSGRKITFTGQLEKQ